MAVKEVLLDRWIDGTSCVTKKGEAATSQKGHGWYFFVNSLQIIAYRHKSTSIYRHERPTFCVSPKAVSESLTPTYEVDLGFRHLPGSLRMDATQQWHVLLTICALWGDNDRLPRQRLAREKEELEFNQTCVSYHVHVPSILTAKEFRTRFRKRKRE